MATYGRKQAIRDKCIDCCGGFVREVKRCTAYNCPLWKFRMGVAAKEGASDDSVGIDDCAPDADSDDEDE